MNLRMEPVRNAITLSFRDNELETAFRHDYFEKRLPQLRLDLILGTILYSLFGIHDYWVIPDIKEFAWLIRYLIVCPVLIGILICSYSAYFRKVMELSIFIAGFIAGGGAVLMIVMAAPPGNYITYPGLLIILLFYFRLRFITASFLTWSIFILYGAVALWDAGIPSRIMYSNLFILSTFSITGLFMCYTLERNMRSAFLLRRTIQERNDEIAATNRELEKEVLERRQTEIAFLERMKFLRTLLDTIPNPIFYTDVNGLLAGCNRAYEDFFGRTANELTGRPAIDMYVKDTAICAESGQFPGDGCIPVRSGEAQLRHADGTERNVLFSRADYADIEGKAAGMVGVILDITTLKKAQNDKLRLKAQLFQTQKIEALGQLAGGIAHEFNNILTAILGYSHLLLKHMPKGDPLRFFVDNTIASSERAARLTRDILTFSRKQKVNLRPVSLNEIVKKSESLLTMMIGEDIELAVSLSDKPITVMADDGLISHVLMNLASNARDAMPGGGLLSINTMPAPEERVFSQPHGTMLPGRYGLITFIDTGIGMDLKTRERIFEPFFTTKEVGKGTGLGLSIVYGIVNQHNGFIDVDTEFTKGTRFSIYLPTAAADACRQEEDPLLQPPGLEPAVRSAAGSWPEPVVVVPYPTGSEMLLVAEDNVTVRDLTRNLLQENGYTVIEAGNGEEAIRKFMEHADEIRLLLLDVRMPKKNGWEVYDAIRRIHPDVRVIFMSGYPADILSRKLIRETGMMLLEKPVPPGDLLRTLRIELDQKYVEKGTGGSAQGQIKPAQRITPPPGNSRA